MKLRLKRGSASALQASSFFLAVSLAFSGCVGGGYVRKSGGARFAFEKGNYEEALRWYEKQEPARKDRLLYLLDRGMILHTAGRFKESIDIFQKAIDLSEELSGPQAAAKAASVIANDNLIPYQGEKFEKLLMHVFQVLNYLGEGENGEAEVEVRRLHTKFSDFFKEGAKDYLRNAFATYLSGLVWEANGHRNDAYIDYKKTHAIDPSFPLIFQDLLKGSKTLGFLSEYLSWRKKFGPPSPPSPAGHGELIVVIEEGRAPEKESSEEPYELQIIPVPKYPELAKGVPAVTISMAGRGNLPEEAVKTYPLYRIDEAAKKTLQDQMPGIIARGVARLAAKEGAAVAVGKTVDEDLGIFLGFIFLATNRADLRSWLTLPRSLQVAKLSLPEGRYDFKISGEGRKVFSNIEIKARKKTFLTARIF